MAGLDVATGIAGLVTLSFTCLQGCIKGFTLLCRARSYGRDVVGVRLMIELERHRLQTWAEEAGLFESPPKLLVGRPDFPFVQQILEHLEELLSNVKKLKTRYDLEITETSDIIQSLDEDISTISLLASQQRRRLSDIFQSKAGPWKKLRWITVDEKNVRRLLDDVKGFVSRLESFLEHSRRVRLDQEFNTMLRTTVFWTDNEQELNVLGHDRSNSFSKGAIPAAARWRKQGLLLGVLDSVTETASKSQQRQLRHTRTGRDLASVMSSSPTPLSPSSPGRSMRLPSTKLRLPTSQGSHPMRHFAWYQSDSGVSEPVLLEWKSGRGGIKIQQLESRVDKVSAFLHELEPSFHSLSCRGYIKDWEAKDRYAYVFDLPLDAYPETAQQSAVKESMDMAPLPTMHTLRDMLDWSIDSPSLNDRISWAITLLETLLQLHTAGWLHKELRSNNVLFIERPEYGAVSDESLLLSPMYIAGYVYARLDDPQEVTEPTEPGFENDLYRHPYSMGNSKQSYRKSFDIFSVGCILLELGLWTSLPELLRSWSMPKYIRKDSHQDTLVAEFQAGDANPWMSSSLLTLTPRSSSNSLDWKRRGSFKDRGIHDQGARRSTQSVDEEFSRESSGSAFDLLELRQQLLLSGLNTSTSTSHGSGKARLTSAPSNGILKALEGATGKGYANVVQRFLMLGENMTVMKGSLGTLARMDEHDYALTLEMEALQTLRAIAKVL